MLPQLVAARAQSHRRCCRSRCLGGWAAARREAPVVELAQLRELASRLVEVQGRRRYRHYWIVTSHLVVVKAQLCAEVRMRKVEVLGR